MVAASSENRVDQANGYHSADFPLRLPMNHPLLNVREGAVARLRLNRCRPHKINSQEKLYGSRKFAQRSTRNFHPIDIMPTCHARVILRSKCICYKKRILLWCLTTSTYSLKFDILWWVCENKSFFTVYVCCWAQPQHRIRIFRSSSHRRSL